MLKSTLFFDIHLESTDSSQDEIFLLDIGTYLLLSLQALKTRQLTSRRLGDSVRVTSFIFQSPVHRGPESSLLLRLL